MKGHEKEFQEAIQLLKKRGIVVVKNGLNYQQSILYQYNFDNMRFEKKSKDDLMDLWNKIYLNSYGKEYSFIDIILALSDVTNSQIKHYHIYNEYKQQEFDLKKLNRLTEDLLKRNDARKEDILIVEYRSNQQLLQHLINKDVFFDNGKFYRYDGRSFVIVEQLSRLFSRQNLKYYSSAMIVDRLSMFARHLTNANGIISDWMDYDYQQNRLSDAKADYIKLSNLIKSFE